MFVRLKRGCKIKLQCLVRPEVLSKMQTPIDRGFESVLFSLFRWFGHYNTDQKAVFRASTTDKYLFSGQQEINVN